MAKRPKLLAKPELYEAEDDAPHAAERQAVDEHRNDIVRHREQSEAYKRSLGHHRRSYEKTETVFTLQLGDELDAEEL